MIQKSFKTHQFMWYKDDCPYYFSFLSLPYTLKQLLNVLDHIADYYLDGTKDIFLFPRVSNIIFS